MSKINPTGIAMADSKITPPPTDELVRPATSSLSIAVVALCCSFAAIALSVAALALAITVAVTH
jgi:hypothetical protein